MALIEIFDIIEEKLGKIIRRAIKENERTLMKLFKELAEAMRDMGK